MRVLGIDEAGRGPVIGPLVLAGVLLEEGHQRELRALGVRDSKALSRERRAELLPRIERVAQAVECAILPADDLEGNLTQVELAATARLIAKLRPERAVIDAPVGPRAIPAYREALRRRLPFACELVVENRADARYPVVAAASIVAKVQRDREILELRARYGDFGWGYPSEPKVQRFLREWYAKHGSFPKCVRARWATAQRIAREGIGQSERSLVDSL